MLLMRRMFRGHPLANQRVHGLHILGQMLAQTLMRFMCSFDQHLHLPVNRLDKWAGMPLSPKV